MGISKEIFDLIDGFAFSKTKDALQEYEFCSKDYRLEVKMYDRFLDEDGILMDRVKEVASKVRARYGGADGDPEGYAVFNIRRLISDIRKEMAKPIKEGRLEWDRCSLRVQDPSWIMPIKFENIEAIDSVKDQFKVFKSRTGGGIYINQEREEGNGCVKPPFSHAFVILVLNCEVSCDIEGPMSEEMLLGASSDDLEVIDSSHEIERIYGNNCDFGSGVIQVVKEESSSDEINDFGIESDLEEYFKGKDHKGSAGIYIISESSNLTGGNIGEILKLIPFSNLKELGIDDLLLDIVSCNTIGVAEEVTKVIEDAALQNDMKIVTHFCNGYIYNNLAACYVTPQDYRSLLGAAPKENLPSLLKSSLGESPSSGLSGSHSSIDFSSCSSTEPPASPGIVRSRAQSSAASSSSDGLSSAHVFSESAKQKKSHLVQVALPGFSNIDVQDIDELSEYVVSKNIGRSRGFSFSEGSAADDGRSSSVRITKKFLHLGVEFPHGISWELVADFRDLELSVEPLPAKVVASEEAAAAEVPTAAVAAFSSSSAASKTEGRQ